MMRPILAGAAMGAMMIWMLHDQIMLEGVSAAGATVAFVAAHIALVGLIALAVLFIPKVRNAVRSHRPSLRHVGLMFLGLTGSIALIHVTQHGAFT